VYPLSSRSMIAVNLRRSAMSHSNLRLPENCAQILSIAVAHELKRGQRDRAGGFVSCGVEPRVYTLHVVKDGFTDFVIDA
jgi:hypothetical protein